MTLLNFAEHISMCGKYMTSSSLEFEGNWKTFYDVIKSHIVSHISFIGNYHFLHILITV